MAENRIYVMKLFIFKGVSSDSRFHSKCTPSDFDGEIVTIIELKKKLLDQLIFIPYSICDGDTIKGLVVVVQIRLQPTATHQIIKHTHTKSNLIKYTAYKANKFIFWWRTITESVTAKALLPIPNDICSENWRLRILEPLFWWGFQQN